MCQLNTSILALRVGTLKGMHRESALAHVRPPECKGLMHHGTHLLDFVRAS